MSQFHKDAMWFIATRPDDGWERLSTALQQEEQRARTEGWKTLRNAEQIVEELVAQETPHAS